VAQFSQHQMTPPILLAVPNVSEGRDLRTVSAIGEALTGDGGARLLDAHSDPDHHRSVFTLCGRPGELADALLAGARIAVERIDVMGARCGDRSTRGEHPHVGALDVAPIVYLDSRARGAACAEALVLADRVADELGVPVFLYGELTADGHGSARTRADLRRGGVAGMAERMAAAAGADGALRPDFGPLRLHPTAGATLVAAREPLVAFNVRLAPPGTVEDAQAIAALIREGGAEGLPGVRAMGVQLSGAVAQVSMNVERPLDVSLAATVAAVRRHARVDGAELVGLAPRAALEGFPDDIALSGFDPVRHLIENALGF
jgi:glutamate formiminotransferase / 5-formyltetrahydrofolate cyclo-ligase